MVVVMGGTACSDSPPEARVPSTPEGWVSAVVHTPQAVLDVFAPDIDGWAALHRGDLPKAIASSDPTLAARAHLDLHRTRARLLDLQQVAAIELAQTWSSRGTLPEGTALHTWAALVAVDADLDPTPLLALGPAPADPGWANVHGALGSDLPEEGRFAVVADRAAGPIGDCLRAHAAARAAATPDLTAVDAACPTSLLVEANGARKYPDPLRLRTAHLAHTAPEAPAEWLPATLFSAAWGPEDRASPVTGPTARHLGLHPVASTEDALDRVQDLTRTLDTWRSGSGHPGDKLAADLQAFDVYRTQLVGMWAADQTDPHVAREALRAIRDTEAGRTLGPTRPPAVLALEATMAVRTGHIRAALEPLQALSPLQPVLPELPALMEVVNDLQVASTLGRSGDSKEP
jgi:hypothetical protein